jgi:hypothetical protein
MKPITRNDKRGREGRKVFFKVMRRVLYSAVILAFVYQISVAASLVGAGIVAGVSLVQAGVFPFAFETKKPAGSVKRMNTERLTETSALQRQIEAGDFLRRFA